MQESSSKIRPSIAGNEGTVKDEIDSFARSVTRFRTGQIPDPVFLEYRLRHGVYGQKQDNVHMMRSKIPLGIMSPAQLEAFATVAEKWGHGIAHLTTRQNIQVHFIKLDSAASVMSEMAAENTTFREACGNVVRNVSASPVTGVLQDSAFDITPYGTALAEALLRHPDGQSLGRKFKITLSDSFDARFNLGTLHDVGATAVTKLIDGVETKGFHVVVGGGLGAVPHEAQTLDEFLPPEELLPVTLAMLRLFAQHGEKRNRARARLKFVVSKWGIEKFREEVFNERKKHPSDPLLVPAEDSSWGDQPLFAGEGEFPIGASPEESTWLQTNVYRQRQAGFATVKVTVPHGDLTPAQLRAIAELLRVNVGDTLRIGLDQSLYIRFVAFNKIRDVYRALAEIGLANAFAGGISDPVTCPGADTCKLGITSPRKLSTSITETLQALQSDPRAANIRIHISGCPNSCSQHHIADIGLFGASRTKEGKNAPFFMLILGGYYGGVGPNTGTGDGFGKACGKIPALRVGAVLERLVSFYLDESQVDEVFGAFVKRVGRPAIKAKIKDLLELPSFVEAPEYYNAVGQSASFLVNRGVGECAGDVIALSDLLLADAEQQAERTVDLFEQGTEKNRIIETANQAMNTAARALLATDGLDNPERFSVREEFKRRFYDAGRIFEGVGHYFLEATSEASDSVSQDRLRRLVDESVLFVEEAHTIIARMQNPAAATS